MHIYHLISDADLDSLAGKQFYVPDSLEAEGFIHFSTREQIQGTANLLFQGRQDLNIIVVDDIRIDQTIVFEDLYDHGDKFPHLYAPLPLSAIVGKLSFRPNPQGKFTHLPDLP